MPDDSILEARDRLLEAVVTGDLVAAIEELGEWLQPSQSLDPVDEGPVAADMARAFALAMGELPATGDYEWDAATGLGELGRAYLRLDLPRIAATILLRAHEVAPHDAQVTISSAYALLAAGDPHRARDVLDAARPDIVDDVVAAYATGFSAVASGDLEATGEVLDAMPVAANPAEQGLIDRLEAMYGRGQLLKNAGRLDPYDLRGWHFVLTAGLLLHRSPFGAHMNGRYSYLVDTPERCRLAIERARLVLGRLKITTARVVAADDPNSMILARAAAQLMSLPMITISEGGIDTSDLVVLYDLADQTSDTVRHVQTHRLGETLWIHSANWTRDERVAGDLTSLLAQSTRPISNNSSGAPRRDVDEWVDEIVASPFADDAADSQDLWRLLGVVSGSDEAIGPAAGRPDGRRLQQWAASPVAAARFR